MDGLRCRRWLHGACSGAASIRSRVRESSVPAPARLEVGGAQLPLPPRVLDPCLEPSLLLVGTHFQPVLEEPDAALHDLLLEQGADLQEPAVLLPVQKPSTCSTPARLYQLRSKIDDLPGGREVLQVALQVHLALLAVRRRGAPPRNTRGLTRSVIALIVPPFPAASRLEHDDDPLDRGPHPLLEVTELGLQAPELFRSSASSCGLCRPSARPPSRLAAPSFMIPPPGSALRELSSFSPGGGA